MSYRKRLVLAVVMLLALSALPVNVMAQEGVPALNSGFRPDAPPYGARGPHVVGTQDLVIDGETPLVVTVWYPTLNDEGAEEAIMYPYETNPDMLQGMAPTVAGRAISNAPYDLSAGPYPLVILSHGYSLGRTAYAWLAEHLASHGFVVIAPQHYEQVDETLGDFWRGAITRPQEVLTVLDYVDEQVTSGGTLEALIDTDLVAVIGHSYGGYTSLAMAGARFDIEGMEALCETAHDAGDPNAWLCDLIVLHVADMAELAGLDSIPDDLWPGWGDPRVDAIVSMAGDAYFFGQTGLAEITVPVMALGGTGDTGTPYMWGTHPTYEYVSSPTKARVAFANAEHMIFGATCEALPWFAEIGFYAYCSDPVWDVNRTHDLVNHFAMAFLLAELTQDTDAAAALAPEVVEFPGVTYEAQGF